LKNKNDFTLSEDDAMKTGLDCPLLFNTGKMAANPELNNCPPGVNIPELKHNDFVVFDEA